MELIKVRPAPHHGPPMARKSRPRLRPVTIKGKEFHQVSVPQARGAVEGSGPFKNPDEVSISVKSASDATLVQFRVCLTGFRFAPRLRDLADRKLYCRRRPRPVSVACLDLALFLLEFPGRYGVPEKPPCLQRLAGNEFKKGSQHGNGVVAP